MKVEGGLWRKGDHREEEGGEEREMGVNIKVNRICKYGNIMKIIISYK
jgi:hypothetical protein